MRKTIPLILFSTAFIASTTYAGVCSTYAHRYENHFDGPTHCRKGTLNDSITVNGPLHMQGTTISSDITTHGPIKAKQVTISNSGHWLARGIMWANHATLQSLHMYGPLLAKKSTLGKNIVIYSDIVFLNQSTAKNLVIKDTDHHPRTTPHLHVNNHSTVTGTIRFIGNPGIVLVDKTSSVKGKIINGTQAADSQEKINEDMRYRVNNDDEDYNNDENYNDDEDSNDDDDWGDDD